VQMWKDVGIEADLQVIEYAKYFELNRAGKLPEATLCSWDNATGDPEIFSGYQLNPKMPFSAWKDEDIGNRVLALFNVADNDKRIAGYRDLERYSVENGAIIPLLQGIMTDVRKRHLAYAKYANGWVLPQTFLWV
jgi:peptide/nickel transport system substrate-binding protein